MVDFTDSQRAYFTEMRSLTKDAQGNEVLVGLTLEETEFYIRYSQQALNWRLTKNGPRPDRESRGRYLGLHNKHELARLQVLGAEIEARNDPSPRH